ncbi:Csu type fimbrial protein [Pseudomonas sp. SDO528_S397]
MHTLSRLLLVLGTCCLPTGAALAAVSGQIEARLVILSGCEVSRGAAEQTLAGDGATLDFGSQGPTWTAPLNTRLSSNRDNLAVNCGSTPNSPTQFTVSIDGGAHGDGSTRYLSNGTLNIPYHLSVDAAGKDRYPVGQQRTLAADTGSTMPIPVYGAVVATTRALPAGVYSDHVTVTLDW